jgi:hypothetical protein
MSTFNKVKKAIPRYLEDKIIKWDVMITDCITWEIIEDIKSSKYKLTLSNNKQFMKKWTDRKLNIAIKKDLSLLEKEILFDILDYIDWDNIINFKLLALDYWYSASKMSKAKSGLRDKGLIKEVNWLFFLNPIVWIKTKEISQDLIDLFMEEFNKYWININYN